MVTVGVTVGLAVLAVLGLLTMRTLAAGAGARQLSVVFLFIAVGLAVLSTAASASQKPMTMNDWGVFTVQIGSPILLTLSNNRAPLLRTLCRISVLFAAGDFAVNLLSYLGVANLALHPGQIGGPYGVHYLGLPGSSFAEGIVAFLAVSYVAAGVRSSRTRLETTARIVIIALLFGSEILIRARADFGLSIASVLLLLTPGARRLPLVLVSVAISALLLGATYWWNPYDSDEQLRGDLIAEGVRAALSHPLIGEGIRYRNFNEVVANFQALQQAGVTESGALYFAVAYGIPAMICLYLSSFFALVASRNRLTLPAVMLACLTGSLAIAGTLLPFLGSVAFFVSLIICQREEAWLLIPRDRAI